MKTYVTKIQLGNLPAGTRLGFYENVTPDKAWFEELPESQEEKDHSKCSASFCHAGGGYENCTHPDNDFEKARRNKLQKEECRHENAREIPNKLGCRIFECPDCPDYTITSAEKPQPKQKPSEWIKERRELLSKEGFGVVQAILDFLDSHADIFNK